MFRTLFFLAAALCVFADVTVLNEDNFDTIIGADKPAIVKFFAPWCGHCKRMAPAWKQLGEETTTAVVGDVDCTQEGAKKLCSKFGVRGFPTLKTFAAGSQEAQDYKSGRSIEDLRAAVEKLN